MSALLHMHLYEKQRLNYLLTTPTCTLPQTEESRLHTHLHIATDRRVTAAHSLAHCHRPKSRLHTHLHIATDQRRHGCTPTCTLPQTKESRLHSHLHIATVQRSHGCTPTCTLPQTEDSRLHSHLHIATDRRVTAARMDAQRPAPPEPGAHPPLSSHPLHPLHPTLPTQPPPL